MVYLLMRVRGTLNLKQGVKDTFRMLNLNKSYSCIPLPKDNPVYEGMLRKVKDFAIFGPVSDEVLEELLNNRLKRKDGGKVTPAFVKKVIKDLKKGKLLTHISEVEPVLKLHPPRGGFRKKGLKKTVKQGGDAGFHELMDEVVKKMM